MSVYCIHLKGLPWNYHGRQPSPTSKPSLFLHRHGRRFQLQQSVDTHHTESQPLKLRVPGGASNILNSTLVDTAGQSLYSTSGDSKRTKLVSYRDNVEIASIQWDRHSPRMVFRGKKMKCKEWLKLAGPDNEYMSTSR
jgi:hypothetical protein